MRRVLALVAVAGCRFGFDDIPTPGTGPDAAIPSAFTGVDLPPGGTMVGSVRAPDGSLYVIAGAVRVFASSNQGQSWTECGEPLAPIEVLAIDPATGTIYADGDQAVLRSADHCATWTSLGFDRDANTIGVIGATPVVGSDDGTYQWDGAMWTRYSTPFDGHGVGNVVVDPNNLLRVFITSDGGIERSLDGGTSWTVVNTGLSGLGVEFLVLDPARPLRVLAQTNDGALSYIHFSGDGGTTWSEETAAGGTIGIDPAAPDFALLSDWNYGLTASGDGGQNYDNIDHRSMSMQVARTNDIMFGASSSVIVTTNRGMFGAADHALRWNELDAGISAWSIDSITVGTTGTIYLGTTAGLLRSDDDGQTWLNSSTGLTIDSETTGVIEAPGDPNTLVTASYGEIAQSSDRGTSFTRLFTCDQNDNWHVNAVHFVGNTIVAAGWADVLTSDSTLMNFTHHLIGAGTVHVLAVLVLDSSGMQLAVATEAGVFVSSNGGTSFASANVGLGNLTVNDLAHLSDGSLLAATGQGVYRAPTAGAPWTPDGLATMEVDALLVSPNHVVAAASGGVFDSPDGATWTVVPGLERRYPQALAFDHAGHLLVGTSGFGLYVTPMTP